MQELNIYWDVSGGWIFSEMDKYAHHYAIQDIWHCVTANSSISFHNPLKPWEDYTIYNSFDIISPSKYSIYVTMRVWYRTIATASFLFIKRK